MKPTRPGEIVARGGLQRLNRRCRIIECSMRTGPEASADTWIAPTCPPGTRARDPRRGLAIAADHPRGQARTPRHSSPRGRPSRDRAPWRRSAWLRPHSRKTLPTRLWPLRTSRPVRVDPTRCAISTGTAAIRLASCKRPERARASASRCEMMSSVAGFFLAAVTVRLSSSSVPFKKATKYGSREDWRIPACAPSRDGPSTRHRQGDSA